MKPRESRVAVNFTSRIDRVSYGANRLFGAASGISVIAMGFLVTYEVVMRYFFKSPTTWVSDLCSLLSCGAVFFGLGLACREGAHVKVDVVTRGMSDRNKTIFFISALLLSLLYCVVLIWTGTAVVVRTVRAWETSPLGIYPKFIPLAFIPIGACILLLEIVNQLIKGILLVKKDLIQPENEPKNWFVKNYPILLFSCFMSAGVLLFFQKEYSACGTAILLLSLIFAGVPIAFTMGLVALMGFQAVFGGGPILYNIPIVGFSFVTDFVMIAIPLFILVSSVLQVGGVGSRLFEMAEKFVGHLPGGLAIATFFSCAVFAAISGSSTATVLAIGIIALPQMLSKGYERRLVYGSIAAGGVLGPLIPPSLYMIVIGAITGESVGRLFMAGMVPGIIIALLFSLYVIVYVKLVLPAGSIPVAKKAKWDERIHAVKNTVFGLTTPVLILGGIYSGAFTPTEAAGVAVAYGLAVCVLFYRSISGEKLQEIMYETAKLTGLLMFLISNAMVFGQLVGLLKVTDKICNVLSQLPLDPRTILFFIIVLLLLLGCIMDAGSILVITYPILYKIFVEHFGFDHIWFAVLFVVTIEVGLLTPPFGLNLFVVQSLDRTAKFGEVARGALPYALIMIGTIALLYYLEPLSTFLPRFLR
ncbi:MAG: TRAP transporter large permease subunit [Candidatus Bathyarchaeia archaeon]